ncbi:excalibur calcium-binding domain-containing protein [Rhodococcus chondri]|uniref:Excalibur calcium-binding domain-containing protein n=1 Tax=Rhodococcus chondri TaxID=3065941 RepID=A0ABU7JR94_9NOCA|nr:excalibur calcium-binding domain-containing protein [Rhodococcus sp. CC-R104]MEE2032555.1 excalibur calcium-binding domain-containing protein [Rhodococcus sp. CC-R104]
MNPPAGWHPDPYFDSSIERFWDGKQWTDQTRPVGSGTPGAKKRRKWPWIAAVAATGVFGIAAFGGETPEATTVPVVATTTVEAPRTTTAVPTTTRPTTTVPTTTRPAPVTTTTTIVPVVPLVPQTTTSTTRYTPPPAPVYTPPPTTTRPAPAYTPPPEPVYTPPPAPIYTPPPVVADVPSGVPYKNCSAARAAGAAPVYVGEPGYGTHLDRDGDGVGCE